MKISRLFLLFSLGLMMFTVMSCDDDDDECTTTTWYADSDNDTYGDPNSSVIACEQPEGYVDNSEDLDDSQSGITTISNEAKVLALIDAFETGNTTALDYVDEGYIQHNLAFPDTKSFLESFITGTPTGLTSEVHRVFSDNDGDIVVTHNTYGGGWNNGTPQVAFDVFRLENGLIVEHWDNLMDIVDDGDGTTQTDGVTTVSDNADTEATRTLVTNAINALFVGGAWSTVGDYLDIENYVQHNVDLGPDASGLLAVVENLPEGTPFYASVEYVYAKGDFALVMSEGYPDPDTGLTIAYYDLFRVENGLLVEHWDVLEEIPDESVWANTNGKW